MDYHRSPLAPLPGETQARGRIPLWAMLLICFTLACVMCGALGAFALQRLPALLLPSAVLDTPVPSTPEPTYQPSTPPSFGLSGQATCRNTKPPTSSPWLQTAIDDAQKYQIDILAFIWQIWQESKYNPDAVSPAGAIGIAQFLPDTAAGLGFDPHDPTQSLDAAAQMDSRRLNQYANRALRLSGRFGGPSAHYAFGMALAAYDAGAGAVDDAWAQSFSNGWPPDAWNWLSQMHQEPRQYVPAILGCL